jgi:hypothetical protein
MKSIRRIILTSIAAVGFMALTTGSAFSDCNNMSGSSSSSYRSGSGAGGSLNSDVNKQHQSGGSIGIELRQ